MQKYLVHIQIPGGAWCAVGYYADTPDKNYRIYYCGSDTGKRFERIGNAARYLASLAAAWEERGINGISKQYKTPGEIPQRGSNARTACYKEVGA